MNDKFLLYKGLEFQVCAMQIPQQVRDDKNHVLNIFFKKLIISILHQHIIGNVNEDEVGINDVS